MSESFENLISQFNNLTDKEKQQMIFALSSHLGKPIEISTSGLPTYSKDEIEIIKNTLKGLILTKQNVPDMREVYERLRGTDLPRKVSFGHVEESGDN